MGYAEIEDDGTYENNGTTALRRIRVTSLTYHSGHAAFRSETPAHGDRGDGDGCGGGTAESCQNGEGRQHNQ